MKATDPDIDSPAPLPARGVAAVWLLRVVVGGVFAMAGFVKMIDPWGSLFKIEEYLAVWGIDVPRTLHLVGAMALAAFEFVTGVLVLTGCLRRVAVWFAAVLMAVMLPLTLYVWIANPVPDCGCFGDFLVVSNGATFFKNIIITAGIVVLLRCNKRVKPLYVPDVQWIVGIVSFIYIIAVGLVGYSVQPLVDFRPYKPGYSTAALEPQAVMPSFVYVKDGVEKTFAADSLPGDDWEYVDRIDAPAPAGGLAIFDPADDYDVTADLLADTDSGLMLLAIPELARADLSHTYAVNEIAASMSRRGGSLVAVIATDADGVQRWQDYSMASYDCYTADDSDVKSLARGIMSLVYIQGDTIRWKRTVSSLTLDQVADFAAGEDPAAFDPRPHHTLWVMTWPAAALLLVLYVFQLSLSHLIKKFSRKDEPQEQ